MKTIFCVFRRWWPLLGALTVGFVLSGCVTRPPTVVVPKEGGGGGRDPLYTVVSTQTGKASYYYGRWIGRKTANGEIYRAGDVTAAHNTLPFNTMVRVTNLKNGKEVIVRINNRGPYVKGRIIDLSLVAAQRIEMTKAGVVPVKIEILKPVPVQEKPNLKLSPVEAQRRAEELRRRGAAGNLSSNPSR